MTSVELLAKGKQASTLTQHDYARGPITTLFVLSSTEFDHVLCCRVGDVYFSKDSIAVIGQSVFVWLVDEPVKRK